MDIIRQLERLVEKLGDLGDEIVIVGGCSPALILDINLVPDLRPTNDIDLLVKTESYGKYVLFVERMKEKGFTERQGDPIGRYVWEDLVVDVIPTETGVLGFSNPWYKEAFDKAIKKRLPSGRVLRTITPIYFLATKLEAFRTRGEGDPLSSPDLEDIVAVMVEFPAFEEELKEASSDLRQYISAQFRRLTQLADYPHFLSAHLRGDEASQAFLPKLRDIYERISSLTYGATGS